MCLGALVWMLMLHLDQAGTSVSSPSREFVLAFPDHHISAAKASLLITCWGPAPTSVTVSAPNNPGLLTTKTKRVCEGSQKAWAISLDSRFILLEAGISTKAIHIQADDDIVVLARTNLLTTMLASMSAFTVYPVPRLSTRYVIVTSCQSRQCFLLIVSTNTTTTNVKVKLSITPLEGGKTPLITYRQKNYGHGDLLVETLAAYNTMQILSTTQDLTGTFVNSDQPVAVFSGGSFTVIDGGTADGVVDQIPPTSALGTSYLLSAFPHVSAATMVLVVFTEANTTLTYNTTIMTSQQRHESWEELDLQMLTTAVLEATRPVLVTLLTRSTGNVGKYDPSAVVVFPVLSWTGRYVMVTQTLSRELFFAALTTYSTCDGIFYMDNVAQTSWVWKGVDNGTYIAYYKYLPTTGKHVFENAHCKFWGYMAALESKKAYSFGFAWGKMPEIESSSIETTAIISPSDQLLPSDSYVFTTPVMRSLNPSIPLLDLIDESSFSVSASDTFEQTSSISYLTDDSVLYSSKSDSISVLQDLNSIPDRTNLYTLYGGLSTTANAHLIFPSSGTRSNTFLKTDSVSSAESAESYTTYFATVSGEWDLLSTSHEHTIDSSMSTGKDSIHQGTLLTPLDQSDIVQITDAITTHPQLTEHLSAPSLRQQDTTNGVDIKQSNAMSDLDVSAVLAISKTMFVLQSSVVTTATNFDQFSKSVFGASTQPSPLHSSSTTKIELDTVGKTAFSTDLTLTKFVPGSSELNLQQTPNPAAHISEYSLTSGASISPDVASVSPDGASISPDVASISPGGASISPDVASISPDGASVSPDGASISPDGASISPDGASISPGVASISPDRASTPTSPQTPVTGVHTKPNRYTAGAMNGLKQCPCPCSFQQSPYYRGLTEQELALNRDKILDELSLKVSKLSASIRRKISAENKRSSSVNIGRGLCAVVYSLVAGFFILSDLCRVLYFIYRHTCKRADSSKYE